MTKREAIIIFNLMGKYMELYGSSFEDDFGSEGQFLSDEIFLTNEELDAYTKHHEQGDKHE